MELLELLCGRSTKAETLWKSDVKAEAEMGELDKKMLNK